MPPLSTSASSLHADSLLLDLFPSAKNYGAAAQTVLNVAASLSEASIGPLKPIISSVVTALQLVEVSVRCVSVSMQRSLHPLTPPCAQKMKKKNKTSRRLGERALAVTRVIKDILLKVDGPIPEDVSDGFSHLEKYVATLIGQDVIC